MTTSKTTPLQPIGPIPIKEGHYYIPGRLVPWLEYRIIEGPFKQPLKAHSFGGRERKENWSKNTPPFSWLTPYKCIKCGYETEDVSELRKGNCNMIWKVPNASQT